MRCPKNTPIKLCSDLTRIFICCLLFISCSKKNDYENPEFISDNYCSCLEEQLKFAKDSSIDIRDCERKVFSKSRLMNIYMKTDQYIQLDQKTIDTAKNFALKVRDLIDIKCYNKKMLKNKMKPKIGPDL